MSVFAIRPRVGTLQPTASTRLGPGLLLCAALLACRGAGPSVAPVPALPSTLGTAAAAPPAPDRDGPRPLLSLLISTRVQNTTEPCGCTSDPLGDVARIAALLRSTAGRGLLLDAGGLRYKPTRLAAEQARQARLKADFLEQTWQSLGAVTMLQPTDLTGAGGAGELAPRLASNVDGLPADRIQAIAVRGVAGQRIGVVGLADPARAWPVGVQVADPLPAATRALDQLRAQGATVFVALTGLPRDAARRLARRLPDFHVVVAGGDDELTDGVADPERVGQTLLVVPAVEGQRVVRIDLHAGEGGPLGWTLRRTAAQQQDQVRRLREQIDLARARLAALRADPNAEPAFVTATAAESDRLAAELAGVESPSPPPRGGYVTAALLPMGRDQARDPAVAAAMRDLDRRVGEANLQSLSAPPPALPGQPHFVGVAGCLGACHFHDDAVEFWKGTHHATAYTTLVRGGKELSYDCVGCHAVGFDQPGGSNLRTLIDWQRRPAGATQPTLPDLRHVGCEVCHGPGSAHIAAPGKNPIPIRKPEADRCRICHTKDHSDTFDWLPYLRDILGPGHGADRRAALPPGPTGHELRTAALKARGGAH